MTDTTKDAGNTRQEDATDTAQSACNGLLCETEFHKHWENGFYESEWEPDTLSLTETEKAIIEEMRSFLPRHLPVYDWNLPYAEAILLIFRRHLKSE